MATGNKKCLAYLQSLAQRCANGVPPTFPIDEDLIKLCIVNQLQRLGLAEHFGQEIKEILAQVYWNYKHEESSDEPINSTATQLYKDSLAFQLLRWHGYSVSPSMLSWFLTKQGILDDIENNHEYFSSVMLNVHRATDLMFAGEYEVEKARSFARKSLEKTLSAAGTTSGPDDFTFTSFQKVIKHELDLPWLSRPVHLEHRTSFHRLSHSYNDKLLQLAKQNYEFRQSIYQYELEELKRWSKDNGLTDMGFGREKTTYCYFAVSSSISLPHDSYVRLLVAKSGIIITVADDFFDEGGSLNELKSLTGAVKRWDNKGLNGHSKTIFDALDNFVREAADKQLQQEGIDITNEFRDIWYETFASWLTEAKWSRSRSIPSMDEYVETGMTSIATHTLVLIASCFLNPSIPNYKLRPAQYETVTKLLMFISRLLNDTQSYQKEIEDGKTNFVLLYLKENPEADIEDSVAYVRQILATKEKEFLEHALMDGFSDLPKACKQLHLSCMKVFHMFFHSSNRYDSNTEMIEDIQKAIYIPLKVKTTKPKPLKADDLPLDPLALPLPLPLRLHSKSKQEYQTISNSHFNPSFRLYSKKRNTKLSAAQQLTRPISRNVYKNMVVTPKLSLSFI
ncbi:Terpene synthase [Melia azedarach]|uniref:Terpene synthase n=1 Tax=Melia azedarach TaxID=155640 RepID=A0ACC1WW20_MELAZ|nr:Terpene synthase [Melia azedarach]